MSSKLWWFSHCGGHGRRKALHVWVRTAHDFVCDSTWYSVLVPCHAANLTALNSTHPVDSGGEHGQLGHCDRVNKVKPTLVQALENVFVSHITCGWSHSVALDAKGRVFSWGNSDHGKLGHGSGRKLSVPQLVEKLKDYRVVRVASYNEHTAALVEPFDHSLGKAGAVNAVPVTAAYTSQIRSLVDDEEFSDVTFMVEKGPVYAHRAILAQRCEHFAAMFRRYAMHCCVDWFLFQVSILC